MIWVVFLCGSFLVMAQQKPSTINIDELLAETDDVRISNVDLFHHNLNTLASYRQHAAFTDLQQCHHQYLVAYDLGFKGQYEQAKSILSDLFEQCEDLNSKVKSKLLLSNLQVISHEYGPAMNNLDYPISQINSISNNELKNRVYSKASLLYRLVDQPELSLKFAELLLNNQPSDAYYCNGLVAKYRILIKSGDQQNYAEKVRDSIDVCEQNNEYPLSHFLRLEWLDVQLEQSSNEQQKQQILSELQAAEAQINQLQYQNLISIKDSIMAKIHWSLGDAEAAFRYANQSLMGSKDMGNTKQEVVALDVLVDYYRTNGQPEKAISLLIKKNASEKMQFDDRQAKTMAYLTIQHENLAKSHQINILNQKNVVLSLENELSEKTALVQQLIILTLLALVGFFVMWGIKHKKIQKLYKGLSERDHMTRIYNRKGLRDHMDELLPKAQQNNKVISLAIFDLDLFKNVNDEYGHITGDWVIKNVIKTCERLADESITLGRLGGEEFAIICQKNRQWLEKSCQQCRLAISEIDTEPTGHHFKITASFGVTSTLLSGYSYTHMLTDADEALYHAKNSGRNTVSVFSTQS